MNKVLAGFAASLSLVLAGCGSLLESKLAAPQTYVLRLPAFDAEKGNASGAGPSTATVQVQRPESGPGLDSNRIALLRTDRRFDYYAASLWAAPAPDILESVIVEALRGTDAFAAVFDDSSPYAPVYDLRVTLRRFEADYTGNAGGAPTVHVVLDCTLGRRRDRALLASFTARGSERATDDRLSAVVAAFETATVAAMNEVTRAVRTSTGPSTP